MISQTRIIEKYTKLLQDVETNEFYTKINLNNRVNCYVCRKCGHVTKTIDFDPGVTPFFHLCEKCGGLAKSTGYRDIAPWLKPTQEWYRPTLKQVLKMRSRNESMVDHVLNGGLDYRNIINQL